MSNQKSKVVASTSEKPEEYTCSDCSVIFTRDMYW